MYFCQKFCESVSWCRQNRQHHDGWCHNEWCYDSGHFPLAPAHHVTCQSHSHVVRLNGRIRFHQKKMTPAFMNEMEHFGPSDRFEFWVSVSKMESIALLACITCRHCENIATNFLQFHFMNPHDFNFLLELSKNVLSRWFGTFWTRVGWVTKIKQLFWSSLMLFTKDHIRWKHINRISQKVWYLVYFKVLDKTKYKNIA